LNFSKPPNIGLLVVLNSYIMLYRNHLPLDKNIFTILYPLVARKEAEVYIIRARSRFWEILEVVAGLQS